MPWTASEPMSPPRKKSGLTTKLSVVKARRSAPIWRIGLIVEAAEDGAAEDGEEDVAQQVRAEFAAGAVAEQDAVFGGEWRGAGDHRVRRKR